MAERQSHSLVRHRLCQDLCKDQTAQSQSQSNRGAHVDRVVLIRVNVHGTLVRKAGRSLCQHLSPASRCCCDVHSSIDKISVAVVSQKVSPVMLSCSSKLSTGAFANTRKPMQSRPRRVVTRAEEEGTSVFILQQTEGRTLLATCYHSERCL